MSKSTKEIHRRIQTADWDYAELSKIAKEHGDPDQYTQYIEDETRKTDGKIAFGCVAITACIIGIIKCVKYKITLKEAKEILKYLITHQDELSAIENDNIGIEYDDGDDAPDNIDCPDSDLD